MKANCLLSLFFFADLWPSYFHLSMQTATIAWPKHLLSAVHLLFVIYYLRSDSDHGGCKEAKVSIHRMQTNQPASQPTKWCENVFNAGRDCPPKRFYLWLIGNRQIQLNRYYLKWKFMSQFAQRVKGFLKNVSAYPNCLRETQNDFSLYRCTKCT